MKQKIIIIDTSILCLHLNIPGMNTHESQTPNSVNETMNAEQTQGAKFVLPMAVIIETGNHIAHISEGKGNIRREKVLEFVKLIISCLDGNSPWIPFFEQNTLFNTDKIKQLLEEWQQRGPNGDSIGDVSITQVAKYYENAMPNAEVQIYTLDSGLRAHSPIDANNLLLPEPEIARRHKR